VILTEQDKKVKYVNNIINCPILFVMISIIFTIILLCFVDYYLYGDSLGTAGLLEHYWDVRTQLMKLLFEAHRPYNLYCVGGDVKLCSINAVRSSD